MAPRVIFGQLDDGSYRLRVVGEGGDIQDPDFADLQFDSDLSTVRIVQSGSSLIDHEDIVSIPITDMGYVPFVFLALESANGNGFLSNGFNRGSGLGQAADNLLNIGFGGATAGAPYYWRTSTSAWIRLEALFPGLGTNNKIQLNCMPNGVFSDDIADGGSIFGPNPYWDGFSRFAIKADVTRTELRVHVPLTDTHDDDGGTYTYRFYYHILAVETGA